MSVIVVGAGGFGREVYAWLRMFNVVVKGYVDDDKPGVLGKIDEYAIQPGDQFVVGISDGKVRQSVVERLIQRQAVFHNFWAGLRAPTSNIGVGCILCPQSVVSNNAKLGDMIHVNLNTTIGHDTVIGNYATLSCHVDIMGGAQVGDRSFFGSGARVFPGVKVGADCKVGAGAIVVNDLADGTTVYAQPARTL